MGKSSVSVAPNDSSTYGLPPEPSYDLPLWNEHSRGRLQGVQNKKDAVAKFLAGQKKLFDKHLPFGDRDNLAPIRKETEGSMAMAWKIMRCLYGGAVQKEVVIDGNATLAAGGGRECVLRPGYTYDNSELRLFVTSPKGKPAPGQKLPALVFAHGGGGLFFTAKDWDSYAKVLAKAFGAVVINVDFRSGFDAEAPAGSLDLLAALKWVIAHAPDLVVDPARVSLIGNSGGGYMASVVALELAARGESSLIQAVFLDVPMIFPNDMLGPYDGWSEYKRYQSEVILKLPYMLFAGSAWETRWQEQPAWLQVLAAPEELIAKAPKHVLISMEFDMGRWETDEYAARLHRCGVLADYVLLPGGIHSDASVMYPKFKQIYVQAFQRYGQSNA